jgi:DnaJ-domain-containing protein 1
MRATPRTERSSEAEALPGPLDKRLGSVLQELGIRNDRSRRESAPVSGGREALIEALSWEEGTYAFEEQPAPAVDVDSATGEPPLPEVIQEAVRGPENRDHVFDALGDIDRVLTLGPEARGAMGLTPTDRLVLARVDGARTIRQVIERTPIAPEEVQQSLFGLLFSGVVECLLPRSGAEPTNEPAAAAEPASEPLADPEPVAAAEAQPPLATVSAPAVADETSEARRRKIQDAVRDLLHQSHFEVLGVPRGSSDLEIREAYFRLVKQFHPDRQTDPALADLKKELEALFIRIGEAYEVLGHPRRRARYEAELAGPLPIQSPEASPEVENALLADDAIRNAEQLMEESRYWDAIQILEAVIPRIQSSRLKHEAQVRLARAYTKNPKWVRRGEELLQAVVREDPSWVDAYYVLGTIYRGNGLKSRAVAMFRKVLELRPGHRPAAAEIRSLEGPPATTKPPRRT